jgi:hypothetical protein
LENDEALFSQRIKKVAHVVELLNFVQNRVSDAMGGTAFLRV